MRGERLRSLREEMNLTQEDLAEAIGVSFQQINRYERGKTEPSGEVVARLAKALVTSSDYLLGLSDDPTPVGLSMSALTAKERQVLTAWREGKTVEAIKVIVGDE